MDQPIASFIRDQQEEDERGGEVWVAVLECGHRQHVRHQPPWQQRPWVQTEALRSQKIGTNLDCTFCDMPLMPAAAVAYGGTGVFDQHSIPAGLTADHQTKAGTWGRIVVHSGKLQYVIAGVGGAGDRTWILSPHAAGVIEPTVRHHVTAIGDVSFEVQFLRLAENS